MISVEALLTSNKASDAWKEGGDVFLSFRGMDHEHVCGNLQAFRDEVDRVLAACQRERRRAAQ